MPIPSSLASCKKPQCPSKHRWAPARTTEKRSSGRYSLQYPLITKADSTHLLSSAAAAVATIATWFFVISGIPVMPMLPLFAVSSAFSLVIRRLIFSSSLKETTILKNRIPNFKNGIQEQPIFTPSLQHSNESERKYIENRLKNLSPETLAKSLLDSIQKGAKLLVNRQKIYSEANMLHIRPLQDEQIFQYDQSENLTAKLLDFYREQINLAYPSANKTTIDQLLKYTLYFSCKNNINYLKNESQPWAKSEQCKITILNSKIEIQHEYVFIQSQPTEISEERANPFSTHQSHIFYRSATAQCQNKANALSHWTPIVINPDSTKARTDLQKMPSETVRDPSIEIFSYDPSDAELPDLSGNNLPVLLTHQVKHC